MTKPIPSAQYSVTMRVEYPHKSGWIAKLSSLIARNGGVIQAIDLVHIHRGLSVRDYTVECSSPEHAEQIVAAMKRTRGVTVQSVSDETFRLHLGGKLEIRSRVPLKTRADLSMAYTPGVARVCRAIAKDPRIAHNLTIRHNCIAVVSDGSAVLGLGNLGPLAAMPVMEGKAVLFKEFGGVDAFPLCLDTQDPEEIISIVQRVAPSFGGINLEDISAPRCFEVEQRLQATLDIPVFHDDQHGTAVVVLAGFINSLRLTGKKPKDVKLVIAGAGAAGTACAKMLLDYGVRHIVACDREGAIHAGRDLGDNASKRWLAEHTNKERERGPLKRVLKGADMFLGVSAPNLLTGADLKKMGKQPLIFALANPIPEVAPEAAIKIAAVLATGRSDYPNQINNVLAFPGIFRGALDARARTINPEMMRAAAEAIASLVDDHELAADYIVPSVFNRRVAKQVATEVARAARASGVARRLPKGTSIYHA